jgi:DNA-directed RNA polymerase specialized sigma24 family protein
VSGPGSDAALLNAIRSGDPGAYDVLRSRHGAAARRLAGHLPCGAASADDVVDGAFSQVLAAIRRGGGPDDAFRPYLLAAVRRAARDCAAGQSAPVPTDEQDIPDPGQVAADGPAAAFASLPDRWRAVLWHADVEGAAPAAVAWLFGLGAAGTAELAASARDGMARSAGIDLADVGPVLRDSVAPAILGDGAAAYLAELGYGPPASPPAPAAAPPAAAPPAAAPPAAAPIAPARPSAVSLAEAGLLSAPVAEAPSAPAGAEPAGAEPAGAEPGDGASAPSGAPGAARWASRWRQAPPRQRNAIAGGAALLAVAAVVGAALTFSPDSRPAAARPSRPAAPAASAPATTAPVTTPAAPSSPAAPVPPPVVVNDSGPGSPPPPPPPPLAVSVTVIGPVGVTSYASVTFSVTNTGHAATGDLTARLSLPDGVDVARTGQVGGWTCTMSTSSVSCSTGPLPARAATIDFLTVIIGSPAACGRPVGLTVTGVGAPASASATIHCGRDGGGPHDGGGFRGRHF